MKRLLLVASLIGVGIPGAARSQTFVKVNVLTTLLGVPGVGIERSLGERTTFQFDATASPWRSVNHAPMQFLLLVSEWRFHPYGGHTGLYLGGHLGASAFRLQKWNYRGRDLYQEGFGALFGGTVGYKRPIRERWMVDVYAGGGTSQALYKGYHYLTGIRYDSANGWNKSGEWLPYRGGVMLSYRIR